MTAVGCGTVEINPPQHSIKQREKCGLAGYRPDQIAPMFANAPANVILPDAFRAILVAGAPPS